MKEVRKLAGQTLIYGFGTIVPRFLNYGILTFFYTRIFDKSEYGVITELYAWMVLFIIILTYGMETGFFRFSQNKEDYEKVYSTALISLFLSSALFVLLIFIFIEPFSALLNYRNNHDYIKMLAGIVAIDAVCAIPFARLRKDNRPVVFSVLKILNVILTISAVFFLLKVAPVIYEKSNGWFRRNYDPDYGVGYVFLANLLGSAATLIMLLPLIFHSKMKFYWSIWKKMLIYSLPLLVAGLSGSISDTLDKVILRRMIGPEDGLQTVGVYGAGYKIAVLMALFIQMFRFAAEPFFFERAKYADAKQTYAYVMKYFVIIMLIVYLIINLYISGIQYIVGSNFREAMVVVPIVSMAYLLYGIYVNHSIWYKLNDYTRFGIYITFIGTIVTVLLNVFFIPLYGYMASAWAHIASYGSMIIMSFIFAEKRYKVNYNMDKLVPYFLIAIGLVIFTKYFKYPNLMIEFIINTFFIVLFVMYAQHKDKLLTVFFSK